MTSIKDLDYLDEYTKEVSVSVHRTINLGNFNSVKIATSVTLSVEGRTLEDVWSTGYAFVEEKLEEMYKDVTDDT